MPNSERTAHFVTVCEFGYQHSTCRCPAKDKAVRKIECNNMNHARNPKNETYVPKHRKEDGEQTNNS